MEHRTKRDIALINLVTNFEASLQNGTTDYLDEKTLFDLVEFYENDSQYTKATDVLTIALIQYEFSAEFHTAMARNLLKLNRIEESLHYINQAEYISPLETEVSLLKAKALGKAGKFEEAYAIIDTLKQRDGFLYEVELYTVEAEIHELEKSFEEMYNCLEKILTKDPENEFALKHIILAAEKSRKIEACRILQQTLVDLNPYNYLAWYNLGLMLTHTGEYEKSIDAIEYSFIINPDFEDGYLDCAEMCCQIRNFKQAANIYLEFLQNFGEDIDVYVHLSECLLELKEVKRAKHTLYRAIKLDGYNDELYFHLGECFTRERKWYRAINAYQKAISIEPESENYYYRLALAYQQVEDYNKATINFQHAISFGPETTEYWRDFASLLITLGLYEEALQILNEAEDFSYGADLLFVRGVANIFLKDHRQAFANFEEALEENFDDHKIIFDLAPELELSSEIKGMIKYFKGE